MRAQKRKNAQSLIKRTALGALASLRESLLPLLLASLLATPALADKAAAAAAPPPQPNAPAAAGSPPPAPQISDGAPLPANAERMTHGRFDNVVVYRPTGTPTSFVMFLSGDDGLDARVTAMAQALVQKGAMVAGIDTPRLLAMLDRSKGDCEYIGGDFENLSHYVQAYYKLPTYLLPILSGYASGAGLAFAVMAQAPLNTFGGGVVLGFCTDLKTRELLCKGPGAGLEDTRRADGKGIDLLPAKGLVNPLTVMQGENDQVCPPAAAKDFIAQVGDASIIPLPGVDHGYEVADRWQPQYLDAFDKLVQTLKPEEMAPPPASLDGLPVIEVPAKPGVPETRAFALLMTGDGGWAGLDQEVAAALSAQGIPVVGLDSLRYYWSPRTPESAAADTDRIIRYYLAHWNKQKVLLVGYSQGADVLPFILNRLPAKTRTEVALGTVMGLSQHALFEFHLGNWVNATQDQGLPTLPEMTRGEGTPLLCIYGEQETDTLCPKLDPSKVQVVKLKGNHHFNGDYEKLAQEILAAAKLPTVAAGQTSADAGSQSATIDEGEFTMLSFHVMITPLLSLIAGILILLVPRLLNYIVAAYLIAVGVLGLVHFH